MATHPRTTHAVRPNAAHESYGSRMPIYATLYDLFRNQIESGAWPPGHRMPPEVEMAENHQVSRTTIRSALGELAREGLIQRSRGRGTFVVGPKPESDIATLQNLTRDLLGLTEGSSHHVVSQHIEPANRLVARRLRVDVSTRVTVICRLRMELGQPVILTTHWLPTDRVPGLEAKDLVGKSFTPYLASEYQVRIDRAKTWLEPVVANEQEAHLLDIEPGAPCMLIERLREENGKPVVFSKLLLRGDKCRYAISWENR